MSVRIKATKALVKIYQIQTIMLLESYNLVAITDIWLDKSHNWNAAVKG